MSNRFKRFLSVKLIIIMLSVIIISPAAVFAADELSNQSGELSGKIEVIMNRNEKDIYSYIKAFERKYPKVDVEYTCYNDFETSIKERMESGDYGDVLYVPNFLDEQGIKKYFNPLGEYEKYAEKYNFVRQGNVYDNKVYGIPSSAYLVGAIYNKEVFHEAGITALPKSIDEFEYAMYLIKENTNAIPMYAGYSEPWVLGYWELFQYIEMTGDSSYKFSKFLNEVNPFREGTVHNMSLRLLHNMVARGYTEVGNEKIGWWDSVIKLNSGEIGCVMMGTWALYDYIHVGDGGENIGFMPFPNTIDGKQYMTVATNYGYGIAQNSDNKEAAKAFLDFILDESGFAVDHDMVSILKTDPYPECYGNMNDCIVQSVTYPNDSKAYDLYNNLTANLKLYEQSEYVRIIESAAGIKNESFEDIMNDWNMRWESGRNGVILPSVSDEILEDSVIELENKKVELSDNELNYINQNPVIKVGYNKNLAPLSFEENGEFTGIAYDICKRIIDETGMNIQYKSYNNSNELVKALGDGEIDFIAGIEKNDKYTNIKYSKEYLSYMEVLVRHNTVDANSLNNFSGIEGELYDEAIKKKLVASNSTVAESIEDVERMRTDFTLTNYYSANYFIRRNNYDNVTVIPYMNNRTYHIAFGKETNPILIAICNKCMYSINTGEMEILLMEYMDSAVMEVTLKTFIKANPLFSIMVITIVFLLILFIFYEGYRAKNKQALAAKKYRLLASLADECIFEYAYNTEEFKFDSKFINTLGFEMYVKRGENERNVPFVNQFLKQMDSVLDEAKDTQFTMFLNDKNDNKQWYRVITSVVMDKKNQPVHMIGKLMNIQKEMEEVTNYQNKAHRDPLTKLYNREGLAAHLPEKAGKVMLAVMDMDNFKRVNDTLGHDGGDYALMFLADKLEQYMGVDSLTARYGGDEFVTLLTGITEKEAKERLEKLVNAMDVNLRYAGNTCKISISAGAVYSDTMESFEDMFHEADKVLYKTKEEGKNNYKLELR